MAIVWTADFNTGIDVIDSQHRRIVDYINQLEEANRNDRVLVGRILDELIDYTLSHFAFEESLQEEAGYSMAKPHKAVHDAFARRVASFQERHRTGQDIADELNALLRTWLVHHIKRDDMAYVSDVRASILKIVENRSQGGWVSRALGRFFK